jgi:hypothetical protein
MAGVFGQRCPTPALSDRKAAPRREALPASTSHLVLAHCSQPALSESSPGSSPGGFGLDLSGLPLGVAQELLKLLQEHPARKERGGHRVPQEMGIDPLSALSLRRGLVDDRWDAAGRVARMVDGFKEGARGTIAEQAGQPAV